MAIVSLPTQETAHSGYPIGGRGMRYIVWGVWFREQCMAGLVKTYFQAFTTDAQGQIQVTGILDIKDYQLAHLEIIQHPGSVSNLIVEVHIGKDQRDHAGSSGSLIPPWSRDDPYV